MIVDKGNPDSLARLQLDLASARILVWLVSLGRDAELTREADLFFFDRYHRLANVYRRRGNHTRARALEAKARHHWRHGGWDGPPYAAAMSMARPSRWFTTDVVSQHRLGGPSDAA